jgi:hypothetical protein
MLQKLRIASFTFLGLLLLFGCSSSKELPTRTEFIFNYQDKPYEIISISAPSGEGYNYLIQIVNDESIFRSMDTDQDGYIDLVQYGEFSLNEANTIYLYGIQEAVKQEKFKTRDLPRIFIFKEDSVKYTIQTFGNYQDLLYNTFTILHLETGLDEIFQDLNANGRLDTINKSERSLCEVQEIYERIIELGRSERGIGMVSGKTVAFIKKTEKSL